MVYITPMQDLQDLRLNIRVVQGCEMIQNTRGIFERLIAPKISRTKLFFIHVNPKVIEIILLVIAL